MNTKLSISNIMKIVNILFLIVLENFILDCGMGFFSVSFLLLAMVYQLFTGGLQSSVSKMVSIRNGKGMGGNSRLILKPAIIYMIIVGIITGGCAHFFAEPFCVKMWGTSFPAPVIQLLCMAFLLNGLIDVICGYQNGNGNAVILNIANLLRMIFPVIASFFIIPAFEKYGSKVAALMKNAVVTSAYHALAVACVYTVSSVVILIIVIILSIRLRMPKDSTGNMRGMEPKKSFIINITASSLRISLNQLFPLVSIAVVLMVYLHTAYTLGVAPEDTFTNMGSVFAKVFLPMAFVYFIFGEYIAREKYRLHVDMRKDDLKTGLMRAQYMIKNSFFMLLPPAVIFTFLADPFVKVFFTGQYTLSAAFLQAGGFLILLAGVVHALNSILKSSDMELHAFGTQIISFVAQLVFLLVMLNGTNGNSMMVLYSFYVYYGMQLVFNFILIYRFMRFDLMEILTKIAKYGAGAVIMMILFIILDRFVLMNVFLILLSMFLGYLLYYLTILVLKGISKKDEAALKRTLNYYPVAFLKSRLRL